MPDHAISAHPGVQSQLDRLAALSPGADVLGLERITALLARLGDPHRALPPVFHVAGTNGKGSTCAFLRAALEADGHAVHVYSSPHLVRFNERIRLAGKLIEDDHLAALLAEVLDVAGDIGPSFFEVTTAAAFLAFARTPASATIVEVGLGGRLDATNVIADPAITGIAALGIDHQAFLGDTLEQIAAEKAGIAKHGVPLATMDYPSPLTEQVAVAARKAGAPVLARGAAWTSALVDDALHYTDQGGTLIADRPAMTGAHQAENYALALAMLRHQQALPLSDHALRTAGRTAFWPARMQRLAPGPLTDRLRPEQRGGGVYLDGAHNESAADQIRSSWPAKSDSAALVIGMLANKDASGVLRALVAAHAECHVVTVPVPGHAFHDPADLAASALAHGAATAHATDSLEAAVDLLATLGRGRSVLIAGSLYLAGEALRLNQQPPN